MVVRWLVGSAVVLVVTTLAFGAWIFGASEAYLRSFEPPVPFTYVIASDAESIAHGEHLVRTRGCRGCHGDELAGELMWGFARAPNLVAYAGSESAATFEAALRHGIGRDGRALYSMPSYNFVRMRDEDVAAVYAYLRTLPLVKKELPRSSLPWSIRLDMALGRDMAIPAVLDLVPALRHMDHSNPAIARGEYIAMTSCNECHGLGLRANVPWDDETAPDLVIIRAYDEANFNRLMRTGIAIGDRELRMMSGAARSRFAHFTDQEVADVYLFLSYMSERAGQQK